MARTHKMNMCHSAKTAAPSASSCHGTRRDSCRALCLLSRRTLRTRFAESLFVIHDLFLGGPLGLLVRAFYCTNCSASADERNRPAAVGRPPLRLTILGQDWRGLQS